MNKTIDEAFALIGELREKNLPTNRVEVAICPPFVTLPAVKASLTASPIRIGAQNVHPESKGAFTGEIAPQMLIGLADCVIVGHSERRALFGETDAFINKKVRAVFATGLTPIFCVGETLAENEAGQTEAVLARQVREGLRDVAGSDVAKLVIAYEPVWAIGTGRAATAADAQNRCAFIRGVVRELYGAAANEMRIQYGGSVTPANAKEILAQPDIDGALVGGASLKAADFAAIVNAAI